MAFTDKIIFCKRGESGRGRKRPKKNSAVNLSFFLNSGSPFVPPSMPFFAPPLIPPFSFPPVPPLFPPLVLPPPSFDSPIITPPVPLPGPSYDTSAKNFVS